jgi:hypothetical protein
MEAQTGVSAKEMSKMGLAAAELDKRLSAISAAGLKVGSEEDKQFLANIAKMGEGGEYEVQIKDDRGQQQTKKLSEITQQEFDKLIKEQKEGPQTLEELARSQMNLTQLMESDVSAIRNKIVGGVASAAPIGRGMEGLRQITDAIGGALTNVKDGVVGDVRGGTEKFIYGTEKFQKDFMDPNKNKLQVLQEYGKEFGDTLKSMGVNIMDKLKVVSAEAKKNIKGDDIFSRTASGLLSKVPASSTDVNTTTSQNRTQQVQQEVKSIAQNYGATTSSKVEMGGKIVIDVNLNGAQGLTTIQIQELQKILADKFRELNIQNYIVNISTPPDAMGKPK